MAQNARQDEQGHCDCRLRFVHASLNDVVYRKDQERKTLGGWMRSPGLHADAWETAPVSGVPHPSCARSHLLSTLPLRQRGSYAAANHHIADREVEFALDVVKLVARLLHVLLTITNLSQLPPDAVGTHRSHSGQAEPGKDRRVNRANAHDTHTCLAARRSEGRPWNTSTDARRGTSC